MYDSNGEVLGRIPCRHCDRDTSLFEMKIWEKIMDSFATDYEVLVKIMEKYTGTERNQLTSRERDVVKVLEDSHRLAVRKPDDGYILIQN